jgi:integrase
VAESARLLNGYTPKGYRGFESHPLRHFNAEKPPQTDFACVCVSNCVCGRRQGGREKAVLTRQNCGNVDQRRSQGGKCTHPPASRIGGVKPAYMHPNPTPGSVTFDGGIKVFPRRETAGSWQVSWRSSGGRRYRTFRFHEDAMTYAERLYQEVRRKGQVAAANDLTPGELEMWRQFREATNKAPLSDVLAVWNTHQKLVNGMPIGEMRDRFLAARQQEDTSPGMNLWLRNYIGRFLEGRDLDQAANLITPQDIRDWLEALAAKGLSRTTVHHHLRTLSMFFNRCVAEGWVNRNPCSAIQFRRKHSEEIQVLSLDDARKLFKEAEGTRMAGMIALEAFGGLRASSAFRLELSDINFEERSILLPASKHKTGRRYLLEKLPDNLWAWLEQAKQIEGAFGFSSPVYSKEKAALFARAGVRNPGNILRHSFCSFHVALHMDAGRTALLMQHANQHMLYRHYRGCARHSDAEEYFRIVPDPLAPPKPSYRERYSESLGKVIRLRGPSRKRTMPPKAQWP